MSSPLFVDGSQIGPDVVRNGKSLPRYRVDSLLAQGGFADVYRAHDRLFARNVAIKAIRPEVGDAGSRAELEADLLSSVVHQNILALLDSFHQPPAIPCLVMPYVGDECNLADQIRKGDWPSSSQIIDLTGRLSSALSALHAGGVVHRDVKPENVLVKGQSIWLADFGISHFPGSRRTAPDVILGTPAWCSPEQFACHEITHASDQYSLALLAFRLFVHDLDALPPISIPGFANCSAVLEKATSPKPEDRYADIESFSRDLWMHFERDARTIQDPARPSGHGSDPFSDAPGLLMDPVHGGIPIFPHEKRVLDHPLFQRLRHITQTDFLSFVFPGAEHSRFQHSLGTMHVAGRLVERIVRAHLTSPGPSGASDLTSDEWWAARYVYLTIRLSALLHDLGHLPFSHLWDHVDHLAAFGAEADAGHLAERAKALGADPKCWLRHENISRATAERLLNDVASASGGAFPVDPSDVVLCLPNLAETEGTVDVVPPGRFSKAAAILWPVVAGRTADPTAGPKELVRFARFLVDGDIDADKMDYLLRDSLYSGCRYGVYNLDHLLHTLRLGYLPGDGATAPRVCLAIERKGVSAAEDFVLSRFQLYHQLYSHPKACGFRVLFRDAIRLMLGEPGTVREIATMLGSFDGFASFTDHWFWQQWRSGRGGEPARRILSRTRPRHLASGEREADYLAARNRHCASTKVATWTEESRLPEMDHGYDKIQVLKAPVSGRRSLALLSSEPSWRNVPKIATRVQIWHMYEQDW